ncbi:MAG: hypothetical protein HC918_12960 [Oscillatoriales cyanobacterium SM2_1_8]|nr:hypothetical protein [Oscillatoriales cyanobacterium SM2_1_8]
MIAVAAYTARLPEGERKKDGVVWACLVLGVPPAIGGGWMFWGMVRGDKKREEENRIDPELQLRETFFRLVRENHGRVTVLRFAMEAQLSAQEAKEYLDKQARILDAQFESRDDGTMFYIFPL